jgi:hypothetical protein
MQAGAREAHYQFLQMGELYNLVLGEEVEQNMR